MAQAVRNKFIQVPVTMEEYETIKTMAKVDGVSLAVEVRASTLLRGRIQKLVGTDAELVIAKTDSTGNLVPVGFLSLFG